jgi:2-polyprenyl-3-methyl-5-hydroxy-6-metoxy-1,4-benzoquinol methylase
LKRRKIDIDRYTQEYIREHGKGLSFEAILAEMRKKHVLLQIQKYKHEHILEVGCGLDPLFQYVTDYRSYKIVEPGKEFVQKARDLAKDNKKIEIIQGYMEQAVAGLSQGKCAFDMIIVSSLLHEVPQPEKLLKSIHSICNPDTVVHINVPNVYAFHRLLAYEMGLIKSIFDKSETEVKFQRQTRFDKQTLCKLIEETGFQVLDFGTYFIKPFSNEQMEKLINQNIVGTDVIAGLDNMIKYMPELGCEMYVNVQTNPHYANRS